MAHHTLYRIIYADSVTREFFLATVVECFLIGGCLIVVISIIVGSSS